MLSTSVTPWHICYYHIPKHFFSTQNQQQNLHFPIKKALKSFLTANQDTHFTHYSFPNLYATTNGCSREQENSQKHQINQEGTPYKNQEKQKILADFSSPEKSQNTHSEDDEDGAECENVDDLSILSNMWWPEWKAALGQRINIEGLVSSVGILAKEKHLVIPHVSVPDIRYIDWGELKKRGFQGVVFDKDNTLTIPYSLSLWGPLGSSLDQCKSFFGNNVAVFSNSAGLYEYDPDGREANALESAIGIKVIRHRVKKPAGSADEVEKHFGCESSRLIMVGDRPFTDIVFGNRNGFFTILTEPLSAAGEPLIVKQVRLLELALLNRWSRQGLKATSHSLFPEPEQCIKDQPQ